MVSPALDPVNVEMPVIKRLAAGALERGEPVWFGCDVAKMMSNEYGVWDANIYDLP